MIRRSIAVALLGLWSLFIAPAHAETKTVTLGVPGMNCELCPLTVKKALEKVNGVHKVATSFERKEVVVTFDDARTNVQALTKATGEAGYPSEVKR